MSIAVEPETDAALRAVEQRVLWLSTAIVDHANRVRPNAGGLKVGGHQASSASMVDDHDRAVVRAAAAEDRVSVKPHASPVLHAINYLLGELDEPYLTTLRAVRRAAELSEPAQGPGPGRLLHRLGRHRGDRSDLGRDRPPVRRRRTSARAGTGRQYSLVGDAELDEGAIWEAVLDPMVAELGEVVWIVDLNRQSLDRVVPDHRRRPAAGHVRRRRLAGRSP